MNISKTVIAAVVTSSALGVSGAAFAAGCATADDMITLDKSGEGNLSCQDFLMGDPVLNLPISPPQPTAGWSTQNLSGTVYGDVAIVKAANGSVCVYTYLDNLEFDNGLTAPNGKKVNSVTVCSNGKAIAAPEPPPTTIEEQLQIVATDNGCNETALQATVDNLDTGSGNGPPVDVILGISTPQDADAPECNEGNCNDQQLAICSDQVEGEGVITQVQCVDRCETPLAGGPDSIACDAALIAGGVPDATGDGIPDFPTFPDGRRPIECFPCALSGSTKLVDVDNYNDFAAYLLPPTGPNIPVDSPYCRELAYRVGTTTTDGLTFRINEEIDGGQYTWSRTKGSVCYKITGQTSGGYAYSYWTPVGCPCDPSLDLTCINVTL